MSIHDTRLEHDVANLPPSAFEERSHRPEPAEVELALGTAAPLWTQLVAHVADRYPPIHELWHFAGDAAGWSLRLKRGERIVLFLTPQKDQFLVGVVLGDRGLVPADVLALLETAKAPWGNGVRLRVSTPRDVRAARALAAAKMAH